MISALALVVLTTEKPEYSNESVRHIMVVYHPCACLNAKKRFENMIQTIEPCVRFNKRFANDVFVVISIALRDK